MNLTTLLEYKNEHLIKRYQEDYPNNKLSAKQALTELMKFFWLSHTRKKESEKNPDNKTLQFPCVMHREMDEIDDMWHTFLLFTQAYQDFCFNHFGAFIHHSPNIVGGTPTGKKYERDLRLYLSYIYDKLGEDTLKTWFAETLQEAI